MIQIPHNTPPVRSRRARQVARWFGLSPRRGAQRTPSLAELRPILPPPGAVTLVTGPSGAGKSSLLRALRDAAPRDVRWIDFERIDPPDVPLVDCFEGTSLSDALALLSRVGLCEAWTYLRTPSELSDGQRWRLKLALALRDGFREEASRGGAGAPRYTILCADEFGAVLDRVTAMVVARTLRNATRAPLSALVATSHEDLVNALQPELIVTCDFEKVYTRPRGVVSSADHET
jgi:ABC-type ATPase with predicted acetyltransferase domain